jgi:hydrogenase/urease accessory protein HupE
MIRRALPGLLATAIVLVCPILVAAHPAPFSYLDLRLAASGVEGSLALHDYDVAEELNVNDPDALLDPATLSVQRAALLALVSERLAILVDGKPATIDWGVIEPVRERQSLRLVFKIAGSGHPAHVHVRAHLFPYDPTHQTFVNVYEETALVQQAILDVNRRTTDYYAGSTQGRLAVIKTFVLSGIEHILIGPDHVLFLIGLLLLGGSVARLALIVTSFTVGHSITLSLAALDIVSPSARLVEPLIALTIVVVGADNLLVLRARGREKAKSADIRAWLAAVFGLIHGFGFAYVLKEFGLPQAALAWSLFAFNVGVEIGQLLIVGVAASLLALLARKSEIAWSRVASFGSVAVILAGTYWFVERTFLSGGS